MAFYGNALPNGLDLQPLPAESAQRPFKVYSLFTHNQAIFGQAAMNEPFDFNIQLRVPLPAHPTTHYHQYAREAAQCIQQPAVRARDMLQPQYQPQYQLQHQPQLQQQQTHQHLAQHSTRQLQQPAMGVQYKFPATFSGYMLGMPDIGTNEYGPADVVAHYQPLTSSVNFEYEVPAVAETSVGPSQAHPNSSDLTQPEELSDHGEPAPGVRIPPLKVPKGLVAWSDNIYQHMRADQPAGQSEQAPMVVSDSYRFETGRFKYKEPRKTKPRNRKAPRAAMPLKAARNAGAASSDEAANSITTQGKRKAQDAPAPSTSGASLDSTAGSLESSMLPRKKARFSNNSNVSQTQPGNIEGEAEHQPLWQPPSEARAAGIPSTPSGASIVPAERTLAITTQMMPTPPASDVASELDEFTFTFTDDEQNLNHSPIGTSATSSEDFEDFFNISFAYPNECL